METINSVIRKYEGGRDAFTREEMGIMISELFWYRGEVTRLLKDTTFKVPDAQTIPSNPR